MAYNIDINELVKIYAKYAMAYDMYINKYMVNRDEEDCPSEIVLCESIYDRLNIYLELTAHSEQQREDILTILSQTRKDTKKIDIAWNIKELYEYLGIV